MRPTACTPLREQSLTRMMVSTFGRIPRLICSIPASLSTTMYWVIRGQLLQAEPAEGRLQNSNSLCPGSCPMTSMIEIIVFDQTAIHHRSPYSPPWTFRQESVTCRTHLQNAPHLSRISPSVISTSTPRTSFRLELASASTARYRGLSLVAEILNQQTAKSRFSNAAFSGDGNYMCHSGSTS